MTFQCVKRKTLVLCSSSLKLYSCYTFAFNLGVLYPKAFMCLVNETACIKLDSMHEMVRMPLE